MDGVTFGVGSSLAHRAMDGIMGPRTVQVEHTYGGQPMGAPVPTPGVDAGSPVGDLGFQPGNIYQQPEWQAPSDPYAPPPLSEMSWGEQEQAALGAAGGLGDMGGADAGEASESLLKGVWNFFND